MKKTWYLLVSSFIMICLSCSVPFSVKAQESSLSYNRNLCEYGEGDIPPGKKLKKKDGYQYYINDDGTVTTFYYYGTKKKVVIPSKIAGRKVTCIGADTFLDNFEITSIEIPDTVISIGDCAFSNCTSLKKVSIPKSVREIGTAVFSFSSKLKTIQVDSNNPYFVSVENVLYSKDQTILYAYPAGKEISSFTVPNGVTCIEDYAFCECNHLKEIVVSNSVKKIGTGAFAYSNQLKRVILPNGITEIPARLVEDCVKIQSFVIPEQVTKIGENAFYGCNDLTSVKMPNHIEVINALAFYNCNKLTRIDITNDDCMIYDEMDVFDESTVIYCNENSTAMKYALKYGNMYLLMGEDVYPTSVVLNKSDYIYNGKVQHPDVVVKDTDGNVVDSSHYKVSYSGKCKNIGFYKIQVHFRGKYNGRLIKEFKIIPKSVKITSVKPQSKGFVLKWKKQNLKKAYYEIQYATNKKFKNAKKIKISKMSTKSRIVKKLKPNQKYYVRMRVCKGTYKDIYYYVLKSKWSKVKTIKTKK